jgi:hypothetical protein
MDLLNRMRGFGGGLLDAARRFGEHEYQPNSSVAAEGMAGPYAPLARAQYDRDYRVARGRAIRQGARWYEMDDEAASAAQGAYDDGMVRAMQIAEALRGRREKEGRAMALAEAIKSMRGSGQMSDQQAAALSAVDPDAAGEILAKASFPNSEGTAQSGRIVDTFRGSDGMVHAVIQTGDPANPVKTINTETREDSSTAEIRTLQALMASQQLMNTVQAKGAAGAFGTEQGKIDAIARSTLPAARTNLKNNIGRMERLRDEMEKLDSGQVAGRVAPYFGPEWQAVNAALTEEALLMVGQLKDLGVNLQPITEKELAILMNTSPKLTNKKEANVKIINERIRRANNVLAELQRQIDHLKKGGSMVNYGIEAPAGETAAERAKRLGL